MTEEDALSSRFANAAGAACPTPATAGHSSKPVTTKCAPTPVTSMPRRRSITTVEEINKQARHAAHSLNVDNPSNDLGMSKIRSFAQAVGLLARDDAGTPPEGVMPPPRGGGAGATLSQALTLDAVFRAFMFLQTSAMQLTLDVWRGERLIEKPSIVRKPDMESTLSAFLAETVNSLTGRGNAYWLKRHGPAGEVIHLENLPPLEVHPYRDETTGRIRYSYRGKTYTATDIQHLKFLRITGEQTGLGPVQAFQRGLGGALAQATYADQWFEKSGVPNGVLKSDQKLTASEAEEYKKRWMEQRSRDSGPAVLGAGLDYAFLQLKPNEVQWLESQKFSVTQIARLFGIPATYMLAVVEGTSQTYQNQEQADIAFVRFTLMAYLREIEEAFTAILPRGQQARFNVDALLRTDTKTRYEAHEIGLRAGFLNVEEVRDIEGLDPTRTPVKESDNDAITH